MIDYIKVASGAVEEGALVEIWNHETDREPGNLIESSYLSSSSDSTKITLGNLPPNTTIWITARDAAGNRSGAISKVIPD